MKYDVISLLIWMYEAGWITNDYLVKFETWFLIIRVALSAQAASEGKCE